MSRRINKHDDFFADLGLDTKPARRIGTAFIAFCLFCAALSLVMIGLFIWGLVELIQFLATLS